DYKDNHFLITSTKRSSTLATFSSLQMLLKIAFRVRHFFFFFLSNIVRALMSFLSPRQPLHLVVVVAHCFRLNGRFQVQVRWGGSSASCIIPVEDFVYVHEVRHKSKRKDRLLRSSRIRLKFCSAPRRSEDNWPGADAACSSNLLAYRHLRHNLFAGLCLPLKFKERIAEPVHVFQGIKNPCWKMLKSNCCLFFCNHSEWFLCICFYLPLAVGGKGNWKSFVQTKLHIFECHFAVSPK
ncbi:Hypothetical predicted protein, partial [Drosophila guanche]